ncbi:Imm21 family immunity protein [Streptomyces roseoverticillatus]|uniref:Imm21 family immunity protein n=1 Tax=Streptomyces roseoverticillatus TaxID=66429 RepID=UPI001F45ED72|nr:Imm21 family immunity protein [Streptomyces roseoverticillatus]
MTTSRNVSRRLRTDLAWVQSMGGPLIVIPSSVVDQWGGGTEDGMILGDTDVPDDYDRACGVEGLAGVIPVGEEGLGLVLADEPATTCYLNEHNVFLRWLAAGSDTELLEAAKTSLRDPATGWEDCGIWETDGTAVLMDSAVAGVDLTVPYPDHGGLPEQARIPLSAGRWSIRAAHTASDFARVGLVQLLPSS